MAYSLTLHFTAGDRSVSVLREGYKSGNQVGAKGRHATQTCSLSIRSYEVSAMLLQEEAPLIRAELKDDGVIIFQGVVRPYQSVSAKNNTENLFSLQLMDDTEVLENTAITEAVDFLGKTLAWCVGYLYNLAGIPETLVTPPELNAIDVPFFSLSPEKYAKVSDQLEAMLWEYGYDYKFSGTNCNIVKTWTDGTGLEAVNVRNTLKVQRNDNWSDGVKVNYGVMEICRQIPLAQWKEDVADLQSWRYILPWTYSTSSGHVTRTISYDPFFTGNKPSNFKTEYILGAQNCQARSVQNCTILGIDPHAQSVAVEFSWSNLRQNYVWGNPIADWPHFSIYGDIIYAIPGDYQENITGDKPDEFTLEYIRSKSGAQAFAEREYKRAKCAPVTFSFQALENYEAGSFYRLTDSVTGINAVIRILSCSMNADGIYSVTAESADYINMSVETEELKLRDALDVDTEIILEVSADSVGEGSSVTVTASGRLLDIIESQDSDTFIYRWELNGEAVPAWDDLTEITATFAELGDDDNVFKFSVYHVEGDTQVLLGFALASTLKYIEGKDGDSAEIQYAIGDSITEPPQGDMLWNDVPMQWDSENMTWAAVEYTDEVPDMERARYIWMRTRVGDGDWQYTRLTGSTSWDPENLGIATTACPTRSKGNLNLVKGDYFVAGAQFTDPVDGNTYQAGYAYTYNGSEWEPLDLTDADSARKASDLLDNLVTANTQIPSSNSQYSVWTWAKNFVAQNAVINNLFSQKIVILNDGCIHSEFYNDDGTIKADVTATGILATATVVDAHLFLVKCGNYSGRFWWQWSSATGLWNAVLGNPLGTNLSVETFLSDYGLSVSRNTHFTTNLIHVDVSPNSGVSSGFWLGANGELRCQNASISGRINADQFRITDAIVKWGHHSYGEIGTFYIDLTSEYGAGVGDLITLSWGSLTGDATANPVINNCFSFILGDSMGTSSHEKILVSANGVTISYIRNVSNVPYGLKVDVTASAYPANLPVKIAIQTYNG